MSTKLADIKCVLEIREEEVFVNHWHGQIVNIFVNKNKHVRFFAEVV